MTCGLLDPANKTIFYPNWDPAKKVYSFNGIEPRRKLYDVLANKLILHLTMSGVR